MRRQNETKNAVSIKISWQILRVMAAYVTRYGLIMFREKCDVSAIGGSCFQFDPDMPVARSGFGGRGIFDLAERGARRGAIERH
jgi:hypothetical protein